MNNQEELKEIFEEMQENFQKGQKLVHKAKKLMGLPMSGMGQRNFPHDLPPAYPQYPGEMDTWMNRMQRGMGERNSGGMSGMGERGGFGERNHEGGGGYDPRYM